MALNYPGSFKCPMRCFTLCLLMIYGIGYAFGQSFCGSVIDAISGERLPYVAFRLDEGNGTISNAEGYYRISGAPGDRVRVSMIGYQTQEMTLADLPAVLKLEPIRNTLSEVVVRPVDTEAILNRIVEQLTADYKKERRREKCYFLRVLLEDKKHTDLMESFIRAASVVNLRDTYLLSGQQDKDMFGDRSGMMLYFSNIHKHTGIGPMTFRSPFWKDVIKPLQTLSSTRKYYRVKVEKVASESEGPLFYKIQFEWDHKMTTRLADTRYMTGTLYADVQTCRPLRFDGIVNNMYQQVNLRRMPSNMRFHIGYDISEGCTQVSTISIQGGNDMMRYRSLLFNVSDEDLQGKEAGKTEDNLVSSIYDAGYDSTLWTKNDIVARTKDEEMAAFGRLSTDQNQTSVAENFPEPVDTAFRHILERLKIRGKEFPQEKVFVHLDNTGYFLGDTVWFAAYVQQTDKEIPSKMSSVLYVELLNDEGYLVERKMVSVYGGYGNGNFVLGDKARYAGFYELRAYTRWQLNWGQTERAHSGEASRWFLNSELEANYFRDYDKLYSRVFPVYDMPQKPGDYMPEMSFRPHFREREGKKRKLKVVLYPEGGNLVQGVSNRVAFEAVWSDGEWARGTLYVDEDSVPVLHRGRGCFSITPLRAVAPSIRFRGEDGKWTNVDCPDVRPEGVALKVVQQDSVWSITVNPSTSLSGRLLALSVIHEGKVEAFKTIHEEGNGYDFRFSRPGVYQATVFDADGRVYADRLFFVKSTEGHSPTLSFSVGEGFAPYEAVRVKVKASSQYGRLLQNRLSIAVRDADAVSPTWDAANIMTEMLLSSELRGFIPSPQWYFEKDDEEHRKALDLLMMTQGWRRFEWKQYASEPEMNMPQPCERRQPLLLGKIYNTGSIDPRVQSLKRQETILHPDDMTFLVDSTKVSPVDTDDFGMDFSDKVNDESILHYKLVSTGGIEAANRMKTKEGRFELPIPCYYGNCYLYLAATPVSRELASKPHKWEEISEPEYLTAKQLRRSTISPSDRQVLIDYHFPRFVSPYSHYQVQLPRNPLSPALGRDDVGQNLRELQVTKHRKGLSRFDDRFPVLILNAQDAENDIIDAGLYKTHEMLVHTYLGDMGQENTRFAVDADIAEDNGMSNPVTYGEKISHRAGLTGDSLLSSKPIDFENMPPGEKRKYLGLGVFWKHVIYTDFAPRKADGTNYYGADLPEVYVADYIYESEQQHPVFADRCVFMPGFAYPAEFYSPDYSRQTPPEPTDYRRTLYWNPNLRLDENGEATVSFYNNSRHTTLSIEAEGQAADGTLLWGQW